MTCPTLDRPVTHLPTLDRPLEVIVRRAVPAELPAGLPVTTSHRRLFRQLMTLLVVTVLTVEVIALRPYLGHAFNALSDPDLGWLAGAVTAELASMVALALLQRRMVSAGGTRISLRRMITMIYAANAVSVSLPAGPALASGYTFRRLRGWGASIPLATFVLIASGVLSTLAFGLLGVVAVILAGGQASNSVALGIGIALAAGAALIARSLIRRPHLIVRIAGQGLLYVNRLRRRDPQSGVARLHAIVADLIGIRPRRQDWAAGLTFAGSNWVADLICLIACVRAVGGDEATIGLVVLAYVAGMSASSISLVPGGLGVVDAAMILVLTHGGLGAGTATAAVLLYRLVSYVFIAALGWIVLAFGIPRPVTASR